MGFKLYSAKTVIPSLLLGIVCSVLTGRMVERQAAPNFDLHQSLLAARHELAQTVQCKPEALHPLGDGLGAYNRKILNARLLVRYSADEQQRILDSYLRELIPDSGRLARLPLASRRIGIFVSAGVGAVSLLLFFNVIWLSLTACRYAVRHAVKP